MIQDKIVDFVDNSIGKLNKGISPQAYFLAFFDWASHLAMSPRKQLEIVKGSVPRRQVSVESKGSGEVKVNADARFVSPSWKKFPYHYLHEGFNFCEAWVDSVTTGVPGVDRHHEQMVNATMRQFLQMISPASLPWTHPDVIEETFKTRGKNLVQGLQFFIEDASRMAKGKGHHAASEFEVGKNVATTPGKVIFKNQLIELIQYTPKTKEVNREPIFIVPAWIMKYYILDLSPQNSMVKYLVEQGHTVFMISWKNPGKEEQNLSMEDYLDLGIHAAIGVIQGVLPDTKIHGVGYCLGGTLLAVAAMAMDSESKNNYFKSLTLLASQTDFTEAGEIRLFIDESQIQALEANMKTRGYLEGSQMGDAFRALRPYELIWSQILQEYFMGKRQKFNDIMAWNSDTTRMPARMHSEYLRTLYLNNDLTQGRFLVNRQAVSLQNLKLPLFVVGTESDHVAPWKSVFKIHLFASTEITFLLTSGGHNAGILSEPGHPHRHFRVSKRKSGGRYQSPDAWMAATKSQEGSWWPKWSNWLNQNSSEKIAASELEATLTSKKAIADAPGEYVLG